MRVQYRGDREGEKRVALVPEVVAQIIRAVTTVSIQSGAGSRAGFSGTTLTRRRERHGRRAGSVYANADLILRFSGRQKRSGP